ncbi:MAG TPA: lysine--tRNA ligase [Actinomycetota bacterium]|nr:lysine--tRNA ligase [Actinomycetota bacterium]
MSDELRDYPYAYDRTHLVADIRHRHEALDAGDATGEKARVAGRVRTVRTHGKVAFADLEDATGRIQLFAQHAVLGDAGMAQFERVSVGDIVGAEGEIVMTRRGELSLKITGIETLAPCLRPMPDSWHGVSDVEVRYRQRYLDFIVNPQSRRAVSARADMNRIIRTYLEELGFVEVETPLLQPLAGGAIARPFVTHHNALDIDLYLRVAPELYLKRLLVAGFDKVFELNRSFRNEGISSQHNTEFTMLEAYEAYVDYDHTMSLVEGLVRTVVSGLTGTTSVDAVGTIIDFGAPFRRITMFDAIEECGGPSLARAWSNRDRAALEEAARAVGIRVLDGWPDGKVLMEIFESIAERKLIQPTYVTGMPKDVSPLAKDHRGIPGFTEHADLIVGGVEIAPVYSELNDPDEQRRRFEAQARARAAGDEEAALADDDFLEALAYGMPPAGGFGLGVDRLLTLLLDAGSLREVILFPTLKPES